MKVRFLDLQRVNASFGSPLTEAVERVVAGGWYLHGRETEAFEREFAEFIGVDCCVGCGNGLDALTLVLMAWRELYGWAEGDEVIVPTNTFIATALAVTRAGLRPVFCDPRREDALMDVTGLASLVNARTRCLIPVHLYGRVCQMDRICDFAADRHLLVLEDACQAHGAVSRAMGQRAGALGDAAAFSFYPGKNIGALGDGGCVTTRQPELAQIVRSLANYGQTEKYVHDRLGVNSRLDEVQAAVLRVKLHRLEADNARRIEIARHYSASISTGGVVVATPQVASDDVPDNVFHVYPLRVGRRDAVRSRLAEQGIETLIHYPLPLHHQRAYAACASLSRPVAEDWCATELSLPVSPVMTDEEVEAVVRAVNGC